MSESLKQKAKTIRQRLAHGCCENWNSGSPCDKECDEPLIELSVAQQEIDKKEKEIDSWIDAYNKINETYQRERGLLKQKLHEMAVATSLEHTHPSPEFWKGWNKAIDTVLAVLEGKEKAKI